MSGAHGGNSGSVKMMMMVAIAAAMVVAATAAVASTFISSMTTWYIRIKDVGHAGNYRAVIPKTLWRECYLSLGINPS